MHLDRAHLEHIAGCYMCKAKMLDIVKSRMSPGELAVAGNRMKKALT